MLNLLRPEQKKKIIHEYRIRFFVLALSTLLFVQMVAIILLIPSYTISKKRVDSLNIQFSVLQAQNISEEGSALNILVKKTNDYINVFLPLATQTDVTTPINNVLDNRGPKVRIIGISYGVLQSGEQQVIIQGVASTRQDLLDFSAQLKKQKGIVSADLPLSDFSQSQNINFSLTIIENSQNT